MKIAKTFNTIMSEELEKFNPYHDEKGRFCSANRASFVTVRTKDPSKQHMADAATARMKEAYAEEQKAKAPTVAGVAKGEPMSFDNANSGKTNPNFHLGGGYRINCQTCVVAMEARRRGYDVEAKPKSTAMQKKLSADTTLAWRDTKTGNHPSALHNKSVSTPKKTVSWLESNVKEGERYVFEHWVKGTRSSGHIINLERDKSGSLMLHDPQTGRSYVGDDAIETYCKYSVKYKTTRNGYTYSTTPEIMRIDNLDFDYDMVNDILIPAK